MKRWLTIGFFLFCAGGEAQVLGGRSVFNFLRLSHTPQLTALGGINISQPSADIGMAFNNPALFTPSMHGQADAVFNDFYGGIKVFHLSVGYHHPKLNTNFIGGLNFFNYGSTTETDAGGNILGRFRPVDWVMQLGASRSYLEKWTYGATVKFISSNYGAYRSNGIATDVSVLFRDTTKLFSASFLVKNLGVQLKRYGNEREELPFDLQAGITKRLARAPFSFSVTAQRLHQYNLQYNDTAFNNENGYRNAPSKFSLGKITDHLVLGVTIHVHERVELQAGYNFLRRRELNPGNGGNGLNGFSAGLSVFPGKLAIRYARSYYQPGSAVNQVGLNLPLNQYFGLGKFGDRAGW
ncbi:MAG: type IX secretion system protein PorQ [Sphingobacteriales bacterium]|nr:type IX secretion system protein PorQ [Sphingobacteriales bacterium]